MPRSDVAGLDPVPWKNLLSSYGRFLLLLWRSNHSLTALRIFLQILSATMQPLQIFFFALLVRAITTGDADSAIPLVIGTAVTYGLQKLADNLIQSQLADWGERSVTIAAQDVVFEHLTRMAPEKLLEPEIRRDLDFVREDLWRVNSLPTHSETLLRSIIQLIGAITLATTTPFWVFGLVIFVAVFQALNARFESNNDLWQATWNSIDGRRLEYTKYVFMMGEEFREIRLLGAAPQFLTRYRESATRILERFKKTGIRSASSRSILAFVQAVAYAIIVFVFVPQALEHPALLATVYVSLNLFSLVGESLSGISTSFARLKSSLGILSRVDHLLQVPLERDRGRHIPREPLIIEFKNVSYRYRGSDRYALKGLSITLNEQEHVAVVGQNGAGKSTFLRLLSGLDKPTEGEILVNGKSLDSYRPAEWRRAFHLLLQNGKLYQDFVQDNLLFGAPDARWDQYAHSLTKSLKIAGADAVVRELKSGLNTFIGDWVAPPDITPQNVSGGQQQRLLIARTLIHGGRIIAFDEPTSAMDSMAETAFFEKLNASMKGRGIIYISHRFSTVRRANRILVFENGALQEDGTHESLLEKNGRYAELYAEQAKWYQ